MEDTPVEVWDEVLDINLKGVFLTCKAGRYACDCAGGAAGRSC
ncbi:hypothetical protein GCM10020219_067830 [Nonomuraea dietziae]